jgi:receptor kinase-like protein
VSTFGDIYSYGILDLETVTGMRPSASEFVEGLSIHEYVNVAVHNRVMDTVDRRLSMDLENVLHTMGDSSYKRTIDSVASLLRLGVSCTQEFPSCRIPTGGIIKELHVCFKKKRSCMSSKRLS